MTKKVVNSTKKTISGRTMQLISSDNTDENLVEHTQQSKIVMVDEISMISINHLYNYVHIYCNKIDIELPCVVSVIKLKEMYTGYLYRFYRNCIQSKSIQELTERHSSSEQDDTM